MGAQARALVVVNLIFGAFAYSDRMAMHALVSCMVLMMIPAARSFDHDEPTTNISNTSTADSVGPWINVTGIANASRTTPQTLLSATAGSNRHCTAADESHITAAGPGNEDGTFPKIVMECGTKAYSWFTFHTDRYKRCVRDKLHITSSCARSYAACRIRGKALQGYVHEARL